MNKISSFGLLFFISFHIVAIIWSTLLSLFPEKPDTGIPAEINANIIEPYTQLTGNSQHWNLFTAVPNIHEQEVKIEVVDTKGARHYYDPVLPGLKAYEDKDIRYLSFFIRIGIEHQSYIRPYMERAIREMEKDGSIRVKEAYLLILNRRTNMLNYIESTGHLYFDNPSRYGPYFPPKP